MQSRSSRAPAGVLVIDKPNEMTSFDVVRAVRRRLGGIKAGHTGTLDPLATGVLPICLGEATRIASLLLADDKYYTTTAQLGLSTDTLDITGALVCERPYDGITRSDAEQVLRRFEGSLQQVPPAYSALKLNGQRAYERARRGEHVELEPRPVVVHQLRLTGWEPPRMQLFVHCSKGTYVRSLVRDVGEALGCGATVAALRRDRSGPFELSQGISLEQLGRAASIDDLPLLTMDEALGHLPVADVDRDQTRAIADGRQGLQLGQVDTPWLRLRCSGELIALGEVVQGRLRVRRVFAAARELLGQAP